MPLRTVLSPKKYSQQNPSMISYVESKNSLLVFENIGKFRREKKRLPGAFSLFFLFADRSRLCYPDHKPWASDKAGRDPLRRERCCLRMIQAALQITGRLHPKQRPLFKTEISLKEKKKWQRRPFRDIWKWGIGGLSVLILLLQRECSTSPPATLPFIGLFFNKQ